MEDADVASLSEKEKLLYEERIKCHRDNRACLDYAIEDGIKQGIEIGEVRWRNEEKLQIAKSMKMKGIDISVISECTGLSVEEIEKF